MRFQPTTLLALLPLSVAQTTNPPCVTDCTTKNPVSSQCDGNETGSALDTCRCNTFLGATKMITCIKACSAADQAVFAGRLPEACRGDLFPGLTVAPGTTTTTTTGASGTAGTTGTTGGPAPALTSKPNAGVGMDVGGQGFVQVAAGGLAAVVALLL